VVTEEIREIVYRFLAILEARGIHVDKAVLYGSYSTGSNTTDSDLDLAVISPHFGKDRFSEGKMLMQLAWRIDPRLHPVPLSSESFEKDTWVPLVHEIRANGIVVH
jgi:predicted nucleotidyltransferase